MDQKTLLHTIALPLLPGVGPQTAKQLLVGFGDVSELFSLGEADLVAGGLRQQTAAAIVAGRDAALKRAEEEVAFVEKHNLTTWRCDEEDYPEALRNVPDAPLLLYGKGKINTQGAHFLSVVGTRVPSDRGRQLCHDLVVELSKKVKGLTIVSGLAYGIDVEAHKAALEAGIQTIAIPAHGLDRIYPAAHRQVAVRLLENGGIMTEYMSRTEPIQSNFLARNRIIAGLSEATVVVESKSRGGSLNTAHMAFGYSRDVFAFPGRPNDELSAGCNNLIRRNVAGLINSADDLMEALGWQTDGQAVQTSLDAFFAELSPVEQTVMDALRKQEDGMQINDLVIETGMPYAELSVTLFTMEMSGLVRALPGSRFRAAN